MSFCYSPEVQEARASGAPIVALESTIITHGMPYPDNLAMAQSVEDVIRKQGAVPATIAVIAGQVHIGLSPDQIKTLAQIEKPAKLSRADLGFAIAQAQSGGTTVAATMILAHRAGIVVFATGGIGGVHRGAEVDFDISADLYELGQTPVTVVCAGPKAILDIPKTMEVLETQGVPVIGLGVDEMPAFWSRQSGLALSLRCETAQEIAGVIQAQAGLALRTGILVANPIPKAAEIPTEIITPWIEQALAEAAQERISAKAVTPYLLSRIVALSKGQSLQANIALVRHNAVVAAQIAKALKKQGNSANVAQDNI